MYEEEMGKRKKKRKKITRMTGNKQKQPCAPTNLLLLPDVHDGRGKHVVVDLEARHRRVGLVPRHLDGRLAGPTHFHIVGGRRHCGGRARGDIWLSKLLE